MFHYTFNEAMGKLQGEFIDIRAESYEEAVEKLKKIAKKGQKFANTRRWQKKYFDGIYLGDEFTI